MRSLLLPFDAHNHIHMGPSNPMQAVTAAAGNPLGGMAIMSTHPRDYAQVLHLAQSMPLQQQEAQSPQEDAKEQQQSPLMVVPGLGVHPWFLAELTESLWCLAANLPASSSN